MTAPDPLVFDQIVGDPSLPFSINYFATTSCTVDYVLKYTSGQIVSSGDPIL